MNVNTCQRLLAILNRLNLDADAVDADLLKLLELGASEPAAELLLLAGHSGATWWDDPSEDTFRLIARAGVDWSKARALARRLGPVLELCNPYEDQPHKRHVSYGPRRPAVAD